MSAPDWKEKAAEEQLCLFCNLVKPLERFPIYYRKFKHGRIVHRKQCKDCLRESRKQYFSKPEVVKYIRQREYKRRLDNIQRYKDAARKSAKVCYVRYHQKCIARSRLNAAIKKRKITRPLNCSRCGIESKLHGHHTDYTKPLDVIWLCRECHIQEHRVIKVKILQ